MKSTSLQFKVLLIVGTAMVFTLAVSILALHRLYASIEDLDRISREDFASQQLIVKAEAQFKQQVQEWKNVLLRGRDPDRLERHWKGFEAKEREVTDTAKEARAGTPHEDVRGLMQKFMEQHKAAGERYRKGLEAYKAAGNDPYAGDKAVEGIDRDITATLDDATAKAEEHGAILVNSAVRGADKVYKFGIGALAVAIAGALIAVWVYMRRAVLDPLRSAARVAERIAEGDLTAVIKADSRDEAGQLMGSLARMNAGLTQVVSQVRSAAESVVTASHQVSAGTTDLSQRTEEQASSLEETAASMEELASTVKQNADNAREANALASSASKRAEQGGHEVVNVVMTMGEISDSAKRIADIISVIDGIAFQTNILALNAAVEAARAGDQGRGFAVVAAEVRSLAQRSADAARQIKTLVQDSTGRVDGGMQLVERAGKTMQDILDAVKRVTDIMGEIAQASREQLAGIEQVGQAVQQMDRATQQNASRVEESARAAQDMASQADTLVQAVSRFSLDEALERVNRSGAALHGLEIDGLASASKPAIPASIETTKRMALGDPLASATSAGPGQKPTSPQPTPKIAAPTSNR